MITERSSELRNQTGCPRNEPGKHFHYAFPHEPNLCQLPHCYGPVFERLDNGLCADRSCPCNDAEARARLFDACCSAALISASEEPSG